MKKKRPHIDESQALHVPAKKRESKLISIRLPITMMNDLRDLAIKRGDVGYQQLIKIFVAEGLLRSPGPIVSVPRETGLADIHLRKDGDDSYRKRLKEFCRRHHIRKLSLFGSVLRNDFRPDSDVDVLVEFEPDHTPGLIRLAGMEIELTEWFKRKVDLRTPAELSRYFREEVLRSSEAQYDAAA